MYLIVSFVSAVAFRLCRFVPFPALLNSVVVELDINVINVLLSQYFDLVTVF